MEEVGIRILKDHFFDERLNLAARREAGEE
jgi:hypothetical protein